MGGSKKKGDLEGGVGSKQDDSRLMLILRRQAVLNTRIILLHATINQEDPRFINLLRKNKGLNIFII